MISNRKITIFKDSRLDNTSSAPSSYYVSIVLSKTNDLTDYINVDRDRAIHSVSRQQVNPEFIELSFFDSIQRNRINRGDDLTPKMIQFIRRVRNDVNIEFPIDDDIQKWYDLIGKYEFPWENSTKDDLEKSDATFHNIVSKAQHYQIDINN